MDSAIATLDKKACGGRLRPKGGGSASLDMTPLFVEAGLGLALSLGGDVGLGSQAYIRLISGLG